MYAAHQIKMDPSFAYQDALTPDQLAQLNTALITLYAKHGQDDASLIEYTVVLVQNKRTMAQVQESLSELIDLDGDLLPPLSAQAAEVIYQTLQSFSNTASSVSQRVPKRKADDASQATSSTDAKRRAGAPAGLFRAALGGLARPAPAGSPSAAPDSTAEAEHVPAAALDDEGSAAIAAPEPEPAAASDSFPIIKRSKRARAAALTASAGSNAIQQARHQTNQAVAEIKAARAARFGPVPSEPEPAPSPTPVHRHQRQHQDGHVHQAADRHSNGDAGGPAFGSGHHGRDGSNTGFRGGRGGASAGSARGGRGGGGFSSSSPGAAGAGASGGHGGKGYPASGVSPFGFDPVMMQQMLMMQQQMMLASGFAMRGGRGRGGAGAAAAAAAPFAAVGRGRGSARGAAAAAANGAVRGAGVTRGRGGRGAAAAASASHSYVNKSLIACKWGDACQHITCAYSHPDRDGIAAGAAGGSGAAGVRAGQTSVSIGDIISGQGLKKSNKFTAQFDGGAADDGGNGEAMMH